MRNITVHKDRPENPEELIAAIEELTTREISLIITMSELADGDEELSDGVFNVIDNFEAVEENPDMLEGYF